jgi:peptide-methionine (S)-S-oxide reductase
MFHSLKRLSAATVFLAAAMSAQAAKSNFPEPPTDPAPAAKGLATAVLAGGCFWGTEGVFEHVKGVKEVFTGYAGGSEKDAQYEIVSTGRTGHAESVKIVYDPAVVSYGQLLKIFFSVAHNPTELDHQGNDWGTQYRSAIFYSTPEQKMVAENYIKQLNDNKVFHSKVVTKVVPLDKFYMAEEYHQDFVKRNPTQGYVVFAELPKIRDLKAKYPSMWKEW